MQTPILTIDGSHGEGGGQVLRSTLALSVLTGEPVCVDRIRAGRSKPGLRPQHLTAVRAAAAVCGAALEGDELGSQTLSFAPAGRAVPGEYTFDVADAARGGSAGSVGLVLQTVLLPLALVDGESILTLRGGTHVSWAPSASYLQHVFLPAMARLGIRARLEIARWGFYPAGGGEIRVQITGQEKGPAPLHLIERGEPGRAWGIAAVTNLPAHVPQRMANRARSILGQAGLRADVQPRRLRGTGPGAGIFLFAEYTSPVDGTPVVAGFTEYGKKGLPAEQVAETACEQLLAHHRSGSPVDPHLADQLLLPVALAALVESDSREATGSRMVTSEVTRHLLTNAWVVQQFLAVDVEVQGKIGSIGEIEVVRRAA